MAKYDVISTMARRGGGGGGGGGGAGRGGAPGGGPGSGKTLKGVTVERDTLFTTGKVRMRDNDIRRTMVRGSHHAARCHVAGTPPCPCPCPIYR